MEIEAGHGQTEGLRSDHPENETTTVANSARGEIARKEKYKYQKVKFYT